MLGYVPREREERLIERFERHAAGYGPALAVEGESAYLIGSREAVDNEVGLRDSIDAVMAVDTAVDVIAHDGEVPVGGGAGRRSAEQDAIGRVDRDCARDVVEPAYVDERRDASVAERVVKTAVVFETRQREVCGPVVIAIEHLERAMCAGVGREPADHDSAESVDRDR